MKMPVGKNYSAEAKKAAGAMLALALALVLSPLLSFSQKIEPPVVKERKKTIFYDPFYPSKDFINPAGNFSPGGAWASISAQPGESNFSPSFNFRQDGRKFGGILRTGMDFQQQATNASPVLNQQAMLFARIDAGKKLALYPLASYGFSLCNHQIEGQSFRLGLGAHYDWKLLGISGYAAYANEPGKDAHNGKGMLAGLGWDVRKSYIEVRHRLDYDFRTGVRRLSVQTSFMHWGILYESEKMREGKTTWLGGNINFGNGSSANCLSLWAKAGCDGKISFKDKKWQPVIGITLSKSFTPSKRTVR